MSLDLQLWTAYDLGLDHYLIRDIIHLDREASFHAFTDDGNEEGFVITDAQPLLRPAYIEFPDPSHPPDALRTIKNLCRDQHGDPLTYVRPEAFKALKGDGPYNEAIYRFIEQLKGPFIVILYWS